MFDFLQSAIFAIRNREDGQALVEYALIIALVALACVAGLTALAGGINGLLTTITTNL
jgi:pilus assembly protein Flp/PilA